jgi:hypothetical protein
MSYSNDAKNEAFVASGDLSALLNRIVQPLSDFVVGAAVAGNGFGVLKNQPRNGEHAAVATDGITEVRVGAAVTAGQYLTSAASGWAVGVTSGAGQEVLGKARTGAASGMLAAVKLGQFFRTNSAGN